MGTGKRREGARCLLRTCTTIQNCNREMVQKTHTVTNNNMQGTIAGVTESPGLRVLGDYSVQQGGNGQVVPSASLLAGGLVGSTD